MRLPRISPLARSMIWVVIIYSALVAILALQQRTLIYFPHRNSEEDILSIGQSEQLAPWRNPAGEIIGWRRPRPEGAPRAENRLLVFHGNAGFALYRSPYVNALEALDEGRTWEVVLFEYPGYGARPGVPSEATITAAAAEAFELLAAEGAPVFLLGESLGGGAATALARSWPAQVSGILLITPFSSLPDVAAYHYPYVPARWILRERWDNITNLAAYPGPVGVILAGEDRVIPVAFGRRAFEAVRGPKRLWEIAGVDHNELDFSLHAPWWREVSDFLLTRPAAPRAAAR